MSKAVDKKSVNAHESSVCGEPVEGQILYTAEEERRVVRKIDQRLLPLMFVAYMLQFLDKITLGYSAIMGIIDDTHLHGQQYSWASSSFYFGYLAATYPISYGFVKLPLAKYLCSFMIIWSIILLLHPLASNFGGLLTLRIFLGIFESAITPGFSLITSMWYKPSEHASRHAVWFAGNSCSAIFGGLLSYAIAHISGVAAWKILFIIFGGATLLWTVLMLLFLPDSPNKATFLNEAEREIAVARVQAAQHTQQGEYKMYQVREALIDPKSWLVFTYAFMSSVANGALTGFGSIIIKGFGFSTFNALLLNIPSAVWGVSLVVTGMFVSSKFKNSRIILATSFLVLSLVGALLIRELPVHMKVGRLIGSYLFASCAAAFPFMLATIASNVAGYTKRTVVNAIFFVGYCAGNLTGPQAFKSTEAPEYPTAFAVMIACMVIAIVAVVCLGILLVVENKRRERIFSLASIEPVNAGVTEGEHPATVDDLTDWEQKAAFRYTY